MIMQVRSRIDPADLRLTGSTERGVVRSALTKAATSGIVSTTTLLLAARGTPFGNGPGPYVAGVITPWFIFVGSMRKVGRTAEKMRSDIDLAVAVILDLVNIQTAGGAGIETALMSAVTVGDGWVFNGIREVLAGAFASRRSYWDGLWELGQEWGSTSLVDIANTGRLTGTHGARVRQSLMSKAASLRAKNLARVEHEAQQRTEQMGIPMVLLFVSFIGFIGYPALAQTVGYL
jgi:hypothetical protein